MIGSPSHQVEAAPSVEISEGSDQSEHSSITSFGRPPNGRKSDSSSSSSSSGGPGGGGIIAPPTTVASPRSMSNEAEEDVQSRLDDVVIDIPSDDNETKDKYISLVQSSALKLCQ